MNSRLTVQTFPDFFFICDSVSRMSLLTTNQALLVLILMGITESATSEVAAPGVLRLRVGKVREYC